ncbi:ASCH domain-containing protein [Companilactobacillus nuruki]|uniref:Isomerase n=1 Tax=Companilactobacillus nuruki TaxID=1993540 RepID=A0A2N7AXM0_9LACO|nr:ASCH domain-containing protein [Companilactobacillus nuruki]PMD73841.1 isomerase [Companilactobacillus nuruki]
MNMHLNHEPFLSIKSGIKKVEIRLNDEKRSKLRVGEKIEFTDLETGEKITKSILNLERFSTFKKLFEKYSGTIVGSSEEESVEELDKENQKIYSRDREMKYGALAIILK